VTLIYHITTRDASLDSQKTGEYRPESLTREGFIHFSQLHQVLGVANAFYTGLPDLVLLVVDTAHLKAELKYEPPVHPSTSATAPSADDLFPHLYGPLNFDAVLDIVALNPDENGRFSLPDALS
jgi:uncharacterized protein (DUF952 family)